MRGHRSTFIANHVPARQRSRHVPQNGRHRHRPPMRQMRRQMPRLRQLRAPHDPGAHLRRMLLWQLPEQVCRLRRRGTFFSLFTRPDMQIPRVLSFTCLPFWPPSASPTLTTTTKRTLVTSLTCAGNLGRLLLLRMHAAGKGSRWMPQDYKSG